MVESTKIGARGDAAARRVDGICGSSTLLQYAVLHTLKWITPRNRHIEALTVWSGPLRLPRLKLRGQRLDPSALAFQAVRPRK
jgi:hypothetical protein